MRFGVIGGDRRQAELAQLLEKDGFEVGVYGVQARANLIRPFEDTVNADVVVLPLPLCKGEGVLNCEMMPVPTRELFRYFRPQQVVLAGQIRPAQIQEAAECGLRLRDYFLREELTVANAAITAEGAIQVAMEQMSKTLLGAKCLVLGFGRIGKLLSHRLRGIGAVVSATARKPEDLAWIRAYGFEALCTGELDGKLSDCDVIFNTIPAPVLDMKKLKQVKPDCVCIDLASMDGIDAAAAEQYGITCVRARSLPGRLAPETAAGVIRDTIYYMLSQEERGEPI